MIQVHEGPSATGPRAQEREPMIHLGKAAKCLRERLGYSQREAGKALGISYPHLNAIENGKASPTAGMIERYYTASVSYTHLTLPTKRIV